MATLADCLLTLQDILSLDGTPVVPAAIPGNPQNELTTLPDDVFTKITAAKPLLASSYDIPVELYDNVFITSDIHSDLKRLNYLLNGVGLVSSTGIVNVTDIMTGVALEGDLDWIPERTLLIIIGDIVDGNREKDQKHQDDGKGNIELLLMAYLYNLRIKARAKNSEIRFTVGNHDYQTVVTNPDTTQYDYNEYMYNLYVHNGAKKFFHNRKNRRACLLPFFNACPYIIVKVGNELICVHGGFHSKDRYGQLIDSTQKAIDVQSTIDSAGDFNGINAETDAFLSYSNDKQPPVFILWSRFYAKVSNPDDTCSPISVMPYKMVAVGHCPTHYPTPHLEHIKWQPEYTGCDGGGGCVLLGCETVEGPRLAFVDIGMSACFRRPTSDKAILVSPEDEWISETAHKAEILHLTYKNTLPVVNRHYNSIYRERVVNGVKTSILVWEEKPVTIGGRKRQNRTRRSKKSKRSKSKKNRRIN